MSRPLLACCCRCLLLPNAFPTPRLLPRSHDPPRSALCCPGAGTPAACNLRRCPPPACGRIPSTCAPLPASKRLLPASASTRFHSGQWAGRKQHGLGPPERQRPDGDEHRQSQHPRLLVKGPHLIQLGFHPMLQQPEQQSSDASQTASLGRHVPASAAPASKLSSPAGAGAGAGAASASRGAPSTTASAASACVAKRGGSGWGRAGQEHAWRARRRQRWCSSRLPAHLARARGRRRRYQQQAQQEQGRRHAERHRGPRPAWAALGKESVTARGGGGRRPVAARPGAVARRSRQGAGEAVGAGAGLRWAPGRRGQHAVWPHLWACRRTYTARPHLVTLRAARRVGWRAARLDGGWPGGAGRRRRPPRCRR